MSSDIRESIEAKRIQLFNDMSNGIKRPIYNPFSKINLTFDYDKIDSKFHADSNPEARITLYKGELRGFEKIGIWSRALNCGIVEHVYEVKNIIENCDEKEMFNLFHIHTSNYPFASLISSTFNPECAQIFSSTSGIYSESEDKTIYEIRINANRCILDSFDTGACGNSGELLILGMIFPDEISAVKIDDEDYRFSELLSDDGFSRKRFDKKSNNRVVKNPTNWKYF